MNAGEIAGAFDSGGKAEPPEKKPGQHRWIALASYVLSDEQAAAATDNTDTVLLDHENRMMTALSCIDCEMPYEAVRDQPCEAEDEWAPEVPGVSDPRQANTDAPPSGTGEATMLDLSKVILLDSVGVQVVGASKAGETPNLLLALSLMGRMNKMADVVHHLYFVQPRTVGMMMAQLTSITPAFADEVANAYGERAEQLSAEGKWPGGGE